MTRWANYFRVFCCTALLAAPLRAAAADVLKDKGLTLSGSVYVLPDEASVLEDMKSLRETRKQVDAETRSRKQLEQTIATSKAFVRDGKKEYDGLDERLAVVRDTDIHNRIVVRMNLLGVKIKEAIEAQQDNEQKLRTIGSAAGATFFDALVPLDDKAEATAQKYATLAADPAIKAAIAKAKGAGATAPVLGPSGEFAAALRDLKKWRSETESESIPLTPDHGVQTATVLLNGEPHPMVVDTGSSDVILPGELAEHLNLIPGAQDPEVKLKLADGNEVTGHLMSLKSVRVGRFTVENVTCVVLDKGLPDPPSLLGDTFLSHFVVKLDQGAGKLDLTEVEATKKVLSTTKIPPPPIKRPNAD